jgi:taste receptor type 1 protein 2
MLRTVPSGSHHIEAMVQLMIHFRWNWIVVLVSNDEYGRDNSQLLNQRLLSGGDICIAFQEVLPTPAPNQIMTPTEQAQLEAILRKLQQTTARVVIVFSPELALRNFFLTVLRWNLTNTVWIASESWSIDPVLHNLTELRHTGTFLGITIQRVPMPGFSEFRVRGTRDSPPPSSGTSQQTTCNQECDACLNITASFNNILTLSGERVVYSVYSAVYAVAHALHSLLGCNQTNCAKKVVYPWRVRAHGAGADSAVAMETTGLRLARSFRLPLPWGVAVLGKKV